MLKLIFFLDKIHDFYLQWFEDNEPFDASWMDAKRWKETKETLKHFQPIMISNHQPEQMFHIFVVCLFHQS